MSPLAAILYAVTLGLSVGIASAASAVIQAVVESTIPAGADTSLCVVWHSTPKERYPIPAAFALALRNAEGSWPGSATAVLPWISPVVCSAR